MKTIRLIPILLVFLLSGINLYLGIIGTHSGFIKYSAISAIYLLLGLLLVSKFRFSDWFGILIPVAMFFVFPLIMDFRDLHPSTAGVLASINAIVMVSCFISILIKIKS